MAHQVKPLIPGGLYYVALYGRGGRALFVEERDRQDFNELVARVLLRCNAQIHAFRWEWRELQMILQVFDVSVQGVVQRIAAQHARVINRKLGRKGFLFEHPHRSVILEDRTTIGAALRHMHLCTNDSDHSPRSSHGAYQGCERVAWLTTNLVQSLFIDMDGRALSYEEFLGEFAGTEALPAARVIEACHPLPEFRAGDRFIAWLKSRTATYRKPATLDQLVDAVAHQFRVSPIAITSRARSPLLSSARALIAALAINNGIASLSEVARRFNRSRSTLHETYNSYRLSIPELFDIPLATILEAQDTLLSDVLRAVGLSDQERTETFGRETLTLASHERS